jgi:hypothetical protein
MVDLIQIGDNVIVRSKSEEFKIIAEGIVTATGSKPEENLKYMDLGGDFRIERVRTP